MADAEAKRAWLQRVLGFSVPEGLGQPGAPAADSGLAEAYADMLATVAADLKALAAQNPAAAAPIAAMVTGARADAQAGRLEPAMATLMAATDALAAASGAARAGAAKAAIPEGTVARMREMLQRSASRWDHARDAAKAGARTFQSQLQARYPTEAAGFQAILDSYWSDLSAAIAAGAKGAEPDTEQVVKVARTLRAEMQSDRLFAYLDQSGIAVRPAFVAALDEVEQLLTA